MVAIRTQVDLYVDAVLAGSDERERAGFSNESRDALGPMLGFAMRQEVTHSSDDLAGSQSFPGRVL